MRWSVLVLVFRPTAGWAQTPSAPPPVAVAPPPVAVAPPPVAVAPPRDRHGAPEARRGFQMHFVAFTGLLFPFGDASGAPRDSLSGPYSWQWMPLEVGMGIKVIDELYIGGYVNVGIGCCWPTCISGKIGSALSSRWQTPSTHCSRLAIARRSSTRSRWRARLTTTCRVKLRRRARRCPHC